MKVLVSSLVLIAIAVGSTGCIVADCHHDRGYGVARRPGLKGRTAVTSARLRGILALLRIMGAISRLPPIAGGLS